MSHLLDKNSDKGKAIKKLKEYAKNSEVKIIGLGDSPNDLPLLNNSNYKIVIPSINGPNQNLLDLLADKDFIVSDEPNGEGWNKEIMNLLKRLQLL